MVQYIKIFYHSLQGKKEKIRTLYYRETNKSYGNENADKTFYVIRRQDSYIGCGLFSHVITTTAGIKYALDNGYIPIVDMKNYPNLYISRSELHRVNAWEYYFEQPCGYSLDDIRKSQHIILSDGGIMKNRPDAMQAPEEFKIWKQIAENYVRIRPEIKEAMDNEWSILVEPGERVLGVLCRGTDYTSKRPKNHPVQPSLSMVNDKIKNFRGGGYSKIFLATEDKRIFNEMKMRYKDRLITNKKCWVDYIDGKGIGAFNVNRENNNFLKGLEYLTTIYMLSKCQGLIAGQCGGTTGALLFNDSYDMRFIWDLGRY